MKYLLCYDAYQHQERPSLPKYKVVKEEFESFTDAIAQYTFRCVGCLQVTLSKTWGNEGVEGEIIRQYSRYRDHIFIG